MAIWEVRIWFARCVRCGVQRNQEDCPRKAFLHNLRDEGWYIRDRKTLCPRCREKQHYPKQEVNG